MSYRDIYTCDNCNKDIENESLIFGVMFHPNNPMSYEGLDRKPNLPKHLCVICMVTLWGVKPPNAEEG